MRAKNPSDISLEKFELIRPRTIDLYEVFCAVRCLLRTGGQWRTLPSDFPKWRTVHAYFAIWSASGEGASLLDTFKLMPQRWVVERSFAWLEKNRRL